MQKKYRTLRKKIHDTLERGSNKFRQKGGGGKPRTSSAGETGTTATLYNLTDSLREFRSLMRKQQRLDSVKTGSTDFLVLFLRCCDLDPKKALHRWRAYWILHDKLRAYYQLKPLPSPLKILKKESVKSTLSNLSKTSLVSGLDKQLPLDVPSVTSCLSTGWIQCPPSRDIEGSQLILIFPSKFDSTKYSTSDALASVMNLTSKLLSSIQTQKQGFCLIFDTLKARKLSQINYQAIKSTILVVLKCLPVLVRKVLIVGFPKFVKVLWKSTQGELSQELRDNVHRIEGRSKERLGYEMEVHIEENQRIKEYDGTLKWDTETSMKQWVYQDLSL